ncbi:unnamed protein product, partial [Prorocentrum cordatum]
SMARTAVGVLLVLGAFAPAGGTLSRAEPVAIRAPSVVTPDMEAAEAVHDYLEASGKRGEAWERVRESQVASPASFSRHLRKFQAAQNSSLEALKTAQEAMEEAHAQHTEEMGEMETLYSGKESEMQSSRAGADFEAEAEALKTAMGK